MKDKKPTNKKEKADGKPRFDKNHKLIIPKKPEQKEEIIVLSFEDLISAVADMALQRKDFHDVHGGFRLSDNLSPIIDIRPARNHIRVYYGRDGLVRASQLRTQDDIIKCKKIMQEIIKGRKVKDGKITGYTFNNKDFDSKKEFIEAIIKEIQ